MPKKIKKKKLKSKKATKKTKKKICDNCIFFVPNKKKKGYGLCFQVKGVIKRGKPWKCKGKFFKPGKMKFDGKDGFN
jgi:hypothetical protein